MYQNIRKLRKSLNLTQRDVAKYVGVSPVSVTKWEQGVPPKGEYLVKLSELLGVSPTDLIDVKNTMVKNHQGRLAEKLMKNTLGVPLVKLNTIIQREKKLEYILDEPPSVICPSIKSKSTFGFVIPNDDMTPTRGVSYPKGAIAYCDPESCITPGCNVVAVLTRNNHVVFAQLINQRGDLYLKPLNERYPLIDEPFSTIGKVFGVYLPSED